MNREWHSRLVQCTKRCLSLPFFSLPLPPSQLRVSNLALVRSLLAASRTQTLEHTDGMDGLMDDGSMEARL